VNVQPPRKRSLVQPGRIAFEFAQHEQVLDASGGGDRLALDVGNALGPGVIDQHHLSAYTGSTTALVLQHPSLVEASLKRRRRVGDPFTIVVHTDPDLDCAAAAYLAVQRLTTGAFPDGAERLARYVDQVDQGYAGATAQAPFSLYTAYMLLGSRLALRTWRSRGDFWRTWLRDGIELVDFVLSEARARGVSLLDVDALDCPGQFSAADREEIGRDVDRYRAKLDDAATHARRVMLQLPRHLGGTSAAPALFVRDVQQAGDASRTLFFKDWARADPAAPGGRGYVALSVFMSESADRARRCIISVHPGAGVSLRGLAEQLDVAEREERARRFGVDDRIVDAATGAPRAARPGYANADPWYDGRAHGYTIVDAPRGGTLLSAERIEAITLAFGEARDTPSPSLPVEGFESTERTQEKAAELSFLVQAWRDEGGTAPGTRAIGAANREPQVFISYPHARAAWVKDHVYGPLRASRPDLDVFFDADALRSGVGWLARLADAVAGCRLFVAVYCPEYFASDFCQWELQLALVRDPVGSRGILAPIIVAPVSLPGYCSLVQATTVSESGAARWLAEVAARV
jgi:hypothetical protein